MLVHLSSTSFSGCVCVLFKRLVDVPFLLSFYPHFMRTLSVTHGWVYSPQMQKLTKDPALVGAQGFRRFPLFLSLLWVRIIALHAAPADGAGFLLAPFCLPDSPDFISAPQTSQLVRWGTADAEIKDPGPPGGSSGLSKVLSV